MDRMAAITCGQTEDHCLPPATAFSLIGNETRVQILEALWRLDDAPVAFSALYDAVDVDTSARFNYHLDKLAGPFVRKTDDGYALRTAGENVVRAIVEGSFTARPTLDPFETGYDCTRCGEELVATYEDERLGLDCPACDRGHGEYPFPAGGLLDRDEDSLLEAFDRHVRHRHSLARDGVCPDCGGRMDSAIRQDGDVSLGVELWATFTCQQCRQDLSSTIGLSLLDRPAVVTFHRDNGVDVRETPYWEFDWCVADEHTTVRETDPWQIDVAIALDGTGLELTLDDDLALRNVERI